MTFLNRTKRKWIILNRDNMKKDNLENEKLGKGYIYEKEKSEKGQLWEEQI